jgi:hypothetical protein
MTPLTRLRFAGAGLSTAGREASRFIRLKCYYFRFIRYNLIVVKSQRLFTQWGIAMKGLF